MIKRGNASANTSLWIVFLCLCLAGIIGFFILRSSNFAVDAMQGQRDATMSQKLNYNLQAVTNCLGSREVSIQRDSDNDYWDRSNNAYVSRLNVTVPHKTLWKGSARGLTVSWADHRVSSNQEAMQECVFFDDLMIDSCCRLTSSAQPLKDPICKALAACGKLQLQ